MLRTKQQETCKSVFQLVSDKAGLKPIETKIAFICSYQYSPLYKQSIDRHDFYSESHSNKYSLCEIAIVYGVMILDG